MRGNIFRTVGRVASRRSSSNKDHSSAEKTDVLGVSVFSSISLLTLGLGVWQVQRYFEKTKSIQNKTDLFLEAAVALPEDGGQKALYDAAKSLEGRIVSVSGEYLHDKEVRLGIRSAPPNLVGPKAEGMATNPQGYFIITPLRRKDGSVLFVNRGWVRMNAKDWTRPAGVVTVNVLVSGCEKKSMFSPLNNPTSKILLWLEDSSLVCATDLAIPVAEIVAVECFETDDKKASSTFFPAAGKLASKSQSYVTPETHAVYAITWFSLFLFGVIGTYHRFSPPLRRNLKKALEHPPDRSAD